MIRVLVADDEPHARLKLANLIEATPDLKLIGTCQNGREVVEAVRREHPDLLFLDIQMPELGGFEALEQLGLDRLPYVIFTTAYSEYAAQAFEVEAVDYLLKPFDITRFERALARARRLLGTTPPQAAPDAVITEQFAALLEKRLGKSRLMVKVGTGIRPLDAAAILYIQAEGDYLKLRIAGEELRIRERMKDIEQQVVEAGFVRIHRSVLVNLDHVREMKPKKHGDYEFLMSDGARFVSGSTYRGNVKRLLDQRAHRQ
ncbi:MAG: LytR/AlgR family response regulator transcription factor [Bacillota bacterium]